MLIHQSTTRRKACTCCVKAKRRCDLVLPSCARCAAKGFSCRYVEKVEVSKDRRRRQKSKVSIFVSDATSLALAPVDLDLSSIRHQEQSLESSRTVYSSRSIFYNPSPLESFPFPELSIVAEDQLSYCIMKMRDCIDSLVLENRTTFIHPLLYEDAIPTAYQDVFSICSLYRAKNTRNQDLIFRMLDFKLNALIVASKTASWTVYDIMLALQALILYQIIRIFDGNDQQLMKAEQHFKLLGAWTSRLQQSYSEAEQTYHLRTPYEQWILLESIRRTILTSVLLRAAYGALKTGVCDQAALLSVLPVSVHGGMWKMKEEHWWVEMNSGRGSLYRYIDFVGEWNEGKVVYLDEYEKCLLVACPHALGTMAYMTSAEI